MLVPRRHHSRPTSPCEEVGDLQGQGCPVAILLLDQVAHLIVDADAEAPVYVELLKEPLHGDQHEVQVVDSRALHHPVHSAGQKLVEGNRQTFKDIGVQGLVPIQERTPGRSLLNSGVLGFLDSMQIKNRERGFFSWLQEPTGPPLSKKG